MTAGNFYIGVVVTDRGANLFPVPAGAKHGVRRNEWDLPHGCHAGRNAGQVLFGDAYLDESPGKSVLEKNHLGGFGQVSAKTDYIDVSLASKEKAFAETLSDSHLFDVVIEYLWI
jgi:hypothetical protein